MGVSSTFQLVALLCLIPLATPVVAFGLTDPPAMEQSLATRSEYADEPAQLPQGADLDYDYVEPIQLWNRCVLRLDGTTFCPARGGSGGASITLRKAPWQVQIYKNRPASDYQRATLARFPIWELNHHCGGVLITDNWVLTAAHCVDGINRPGQGPDDTILARVRADGFRVRLGSDNIAIDPGTSFKMDRVIIHRNYNKVTLANDIALIWINRGSRNGNIPVFESSPISLNLAPPDGGGIGPYQEFFATGWGSTGIQQRGSAQLQQVTLQRIPPSDCVQVRRELTLNAPVLCAVGPEGAGVDTCRGDSGGPLTARIRHPVGYFENVLVGIISKGPPCGQANGHPGVYTRIASYGDWIARAKDAPFDGGEKVIWLR